MEKPKKKFIKKQTPSGNNPKLLKPETVVHKAEPPKDYEGKSPGVNKTIEDADLQKEEEMVNPAVPEIPTVDPNAALQIEEETGFMKEALKQESESEELNERTDEQIDKSNSRLFILGIFLTTLIIAGSIGIFYFEKKLKPQEEKLQVVTEEQKQQPKEEKAVFDRSAWSLEILNGSGTSGVAKKAAGKFAALGYKIVKSGNYDKGNLAKTEIYVSESLVGDKNLLLEDVSGMFKSATISGTLKDSTASARIIIGKD